MDTLYTEAARLTAEIERLDAEIQAVLGTLGTDEAGLVRLVMVEFPRIWEERAKAIAYAMLDENEAVAQSERERYSEQVCSPDTEGLLAADAHLGAESRRLGELQSQRDDIPRRIAEKQSQIESGQAQIDTVAQYGSLPAGVPPSEDEMQGLRDELDRLATEARTLDENILAQEQSYSQLKIEYVSEFPILGSPAYRAGAFSRAPREQLAELTGEPIDEILENIEDTRDNIEDDDVRVWDLHDVPAMAFHELGVAEDSVLGDAVKSYIADKKSDESWLDIALAAIGFVAGIIAIFATGGIALVAGGIALAAGGASLYRSTSRYLAESAAENVALDPAIRDISVNEPELLWVVLDVVGLGLDVGDKVDPICKTKKERSRAPFLPV